MAIPKSIAQLRKEKGWNQERLAAESGVSRAAIAQMETGKNGAKPDNLKKLADALGVSVDDIDLTLTKSNIREVLDALPRDSEDARDYVPFYDIDVTAGNSHVFTDFVEAPTGYIYAPEFVGCVACKVRGDSMYKRIMPGATIFISHQHSKKYFDYGQIYLLIADGLRLLKYVFPHEDNDRINLVSEDQQRFPTWSIDRKDIHHVFLVKGYWNQTTN